MVTAEDYKKYWAAMAARSVRRVAAEVRSCSLDASSTSRMTAELLNAIRYQRNAVMVGWPSEEVQLDDDGEEYIEIDFGTYSDGRSVSTVMDWDEGFATLVHHPLSPSLEPEDESSLSSEHWPCHHRPG